MTSLLLAAWLPTEAQTQGGQESSRQKEGEKREAQARRWASCALLRGDDGDRKALGQTGEMYLRGISEDIGVFVCVNGVILEPARAVFLSSKALKPPPT